MPAMTLSDRWTLVRQAASAVLLGKVQANTILGFVLGSLQNPPRRRGGEFLKAYSESPWLRAAVHKVAYACAAVPSSLYIQDKTEKMKSPRYHFSKQGLKPVEDPLHPLMRVVDFGIPGVLSGLAVRMLTHIHLDLLGEAFWVMERNALGVPVEAWPVPPNWVWDTPNPTRQTFIVQTPGGRHFEVNPQDMIWFKEPDPLNPYLRGSAVAAALSDEIATDENAAKFINRFFYNNARPSLVISADGLQKEATTRMEEDWNRRNSGMWGSFRAHFLNRKVDIQVLDQNLQHLQFVELRKFERDAIIQTYGVPPEVLGIIENSNRATIEAADYLMAKWVVVPRLALFDAIVQQRLVPEYDLKLIYKHEDPVPENKEHAAKIALDVNSGVIMTVDERREAIGKDPLPGGQGKVFLVPLNYMAVKSPAEATLEPAPPDVPPEPEPTLPEKIAKDVTYDLGRIVFDAEKSAVKFMSRMRPVYRMTVGDFGAEQLKKLGMKDPFDMSSASIRSFISEKAATKVTGALRQFRSSLRETLREGLEARENLAQLANRISDEFKDAKGRRSVLISRTETGRAANFGTVEAYEQSNVVGKKAWLATPDEKTRDSHRDADGQEVDLDDQFKVGDAELDYPLDPDGPAEEVINCRCTTVGRLKNEEKALSPEMKVARWREFDIQVRAYERRMRIEVTKAFQELQDETMERLNAMKE